VQAVRGTASLGDSLVSAPDTRQHSFSFNLGALLIEATGSLSVVCVSTSCACWVLLQSLVWTKCLCKQCSLQLADKEGSQPCGWMCSCLTKLAAGMFFWGGVYYPVKKSGVAVGNQGLKCCAWLSAS
jgi:hypothetical protein